jgi:hypothetical protein
MRPRWGIPRRYLLLVVAATAAVLVAVLGSALGVTAADTSAKDRIEADPPPNLFGQSDIAPVEKAVGAQSPRAHQLMSRWWASHGHSRNDQAFVAWVEKTLPGPPPKGARDAEVAQVQKLGQHRTKQEVAASTWLEAHGKKDLWKLFAHDQAELLPPLDGDARKADVKAMLKMSKLIADTLGSRYQQSAPYVLHPSLRTDHTVKKGQVCPCSYPSRHASAGAAAATYLGGLDPERRTQYLWAQGEIDWSRIYMAGHVPSDIAAGALLGDMIGEYYLMSRP